MSRAPIAAAALALLGTPAMADDDDEPAPEQVHIELAGTTVVLSARFALDLEGPTMTESAPLLTIPADALVTRATATVGSIRHPLRLTDADAARSAFDALAETAPSSHRASMILLSGRRETLSLDSALPAAAHVLLDLRLEMPTCYFRDARYALIPKTWFERLDVPRARLESDDLDTHCDSNGSGDAQWIAFPTRELANKLPGVGRIGAIGGRLELDERHVARVEIDLSSELSAAPTDLHTAIVIDHSRSVEPNELEAERAIVASYVRQVPPQSRVQVVGYTRTAKALLPDWMPAAASAARIDREIRALAPRNGSNVDAALVEAARWLARGKGTRRLILFTDDRLAERIETMKPAALKRLLPAGTLVHVVSIFDGQGALIRNDETPLAPLAKATDGLAVVGGPDEKHQVDATMLVRPISVDALRVSGPGWDRLGMSTCPADESDVEDLLPEGQACTWWGMGNAVSGPLTVEGFIWGRRITRIVRPDPSQGLSLARMLSASRAFEDDDDDMLQTLVDRAALAVNTVWSMVGTWGGTGGYADSDGFGTFGAGTFADPCCGDTFDTGIGHGGGVPPLDLRRQLAPVVARCEAGDAHFAITIETTVQEIVDVTLDAQGMSTAMRTCLVEGVWDLSLSIASAPWRTRTRTVF